MPARNIVKPYLGGGIYHVYNRGVEKRLIFLDDQDYRVFLRIIGEALSTPITLSSNILIPSNSSLQGSTLQRKEPKNFFGKIDFFAYCLMPNHFHFLLKQTHERDMSAFLHSISIRYSAYFNKKYKRKGTLCESTYKAVLVTEEPYLLHLTRYIHINPSELFGDLSQAYSSYADYLGLRRTPWVNTQFILSFFSPTNLPLLTRKNTYQDFVESYRTKPQSILGGLIIEDEDEL